MSDTYNMMEPILKMLTRETDTYRVREIKSSEVTEGSNKVKSIWDFIHHPDTRFVIFNDQRKVMDTVPKNLLYNDVDVLEDQILFPEDAPGTESLVVATEDLNPLNKLEHEEFNMERFIYDLDTDEEMFEGESDYHEHTCGDASENEDESWEDDESDDDFDTGDAEEMNEAVSEGLETFISHSAKYRDFVPQNEEEMFEQISKFLRREASKGSDLVTDCEK